MKTIKRYQVNDNLLIFAPSLEVAYKLSKQYNTNNHSLCIPFCRSGALWASNGILMTITAAKYSEQYENKYIEVDGQIRNFVNGRPVVPTTKFEEVKATAGAINPGDYTAFEVNTEFRKAIKEAIKKDKDNKLKMCDYDIIKVGPGYFLTDTKLNGLRFVLDLSSKYVKTFLYISNAPEVRDRFHYYKSYDGAGRLVSFGPIMPMFDPTVDIVAADVHPSDNAPEVGQPKENIKEVESYFNM